jgi:hypothetical protein
MPSRDDSVRSAPGWWCRRAPERRRITESLQPSGNLAPQWSLGMAEVASSTMAVDEQVGYPPGVHSVADRAEPVHHER